MPFYSESGEAIIPKPKPVVDKPSKPPQGIPTWKKKAVDVGFQSTAPVPEPTITSGEQLRVQAVKELKDSGIVEQYKEIDPEATYVYESGEQVSGRKLKQQVGSGIKQSLLGITKIQLGKYVKSGEQHYRVTGETRYLIEHAEPREREKLIASFGKTGREELPPDFIGPVIPPSYTATQKAYGSLTEKEKEHYGYTYTPFIDQPVEEWKHYPGGSKYYESLSKEQKEKHITAFVKEHRIEHDPWYAFGSTWRVDGKVVEGLRTKGMTDIGIRRHIAREEITMTPLQIKEHYYSKLPPAWQDVYSAGHFVSKSVLWPVTLTQAGVKGITKGKTILPDISKELSERQMGPSSKIETTIGKALGADVSEMEKIQEKYPVATISATGGELFGMWLGGATLGAGVGAAGKLGLKHTVRYTPKVIGRLKEFKGITYHLKPGGVPRPSPTFITKYAQTPFWKHIHGWSSGKLVKVRLLPKAKQIFYKASRTGVQEGDITVFGKLTKFRGWGKTEWMPKDIASRTKIGEFTTHTHKFMSDMYRGKPVVTSGKRLQIFQTDIISKPRGLLWWKRAKVQSVSLRESERYGTNIQDFLLGAEPSEKYGSLVKYWGGQSPLNIGKEATGGSWMRAPHVVKTVKKPIKYWSDQASASLVRPVHPMLHHPMMTGGIRGMGSLGGMPSVDFMVFPTAKFVFPSMFSMTSIALGAKTIEGMSSTQALSSASVQELTPLSISKQIQQPSFDTRNLTRTMEDQFSASMLADDMMYRQMQLQKQLTAPVQDYTSALSTRDISLLSPKTIHHMLSSGKGVKLPFGSLDEYSSKEIKKQYIPKDWSKGYRFRTWKVPSTKDFMKGVF